MNTIFRNYMSKLHHQVQDLQVLLCDIHGNVDTLSRKLSGLKGYTSDKVRESNGEKSNTLHTEISQFDEAADDNEVDREFFAYIDSNKDGIISADNIRRALSRFELEGNPLITDGLNELLKSINDSDRPDTDIDLTEFRRMLSGNRRVRGQRIQWSRGLGLECLLARHLKVGHLFDEMSGIRSMSEDDLKAAADLFLADLMVILRTQVGKLLESGSTSEQVTSVMGKFTGGFTGKFGDTQMFERGLESEIGKLDPKILQGILRENVLDRDSDQRYRTSNYLIVTSDRMEYARLLGDHRESKIPAFLQQIAEGKHPGIIGPTKEELKDLESEFDNLKKCYQETIRMSPYNKFPGEVGDQQHAVDFVIAAGDAVAASDLLRKAETISETHNRTGVIFTVCTSGPVKNSFIVKAHLPCEYSALSKAKGAKDEFDQLQNKILQEFDSRASVHIEKDQTFIYCQYGNREALEKGLDGLSLAELRKQSADLEASRQECLCAIVDKFDSERIEWGRQGKARMQGRVRRSLQELMDLPQVREAKLRVEEAIQAYQYTGPLFHRWNSILRCMPLDSTDASRRPPNLYSTSIHVLVSATLKLARITKVPPGRKAFRGLGRMVLGPEWFESDARGVRSGVELGFLSTTLKEDVALDYSGVKTGTGTVLEFDVGAIDCGARLDSLSQYPGEGELLFPPLSHLELVGEPTMRLHDCNGAQRQVLVICVRININQKSLTVEEVLSQRKQTVVSMGESLGKELLFDLKLVSGMPFSMAGFKETIASLVERDRSWFNDDVNLKDALAIMLQEKDRTCCDFVKAWAIETKPRQGIVEEMLRNLCGRGKSSLLQAFLTCPDLQVNINCQHPSGSAYTLLHCAAGSGNTEVARLLVKHGANVNLETRFDSTPIHWAAEGGHAETTALLLELRATVDTWDEKRTALHKAARGGHAKVVSLLLEARAMVNACTKEHDINSHGWGGQLDDYLLTPLHFAVRGGHAEVVAMLAQARADVNATYQKVVGTEGIVFGDGFTGEVGVFGTSSTPLQEAEAAGSAAVVAALKAAGAR